MLEIKVNIRSGTLFVLTLFFTLCSQSLSAQQTIPAKAIAYKVVLDLEQADPVYYSLTDSDTTEVYSEVDLYYTDDRAQTVTRVLSKPGDFDGHHFEVFYGTKTHREALIYHARRSVVADDEKIVLVEKLRAKKKILGYKCRAFLVVDDNDLRMLAFVTTKLGKNICPRGNFMLPGTVLELISSDGFHYEATALSAGELPADFFVLPTDYQIETISPTTEGKSR